MPLTLRQRGEVWHARGTIRIGREVVTVREFSTGCRKRGDAETVAEEEVRRLREQRDDDPQARSRRLTVADCLSAYLGRPGGLKPYDVERVAVLNEALGAEKMADAPAAWGRFLLMKRWAPGTAGRWRATAQAALNAGAKAHQAAPVLLPSVVQAPDERVPYLPPAERDALLAAYSPEAGAVMLVLAHQGMRTQEALRMDWRHVVLTHGREVIRIPAERSKSGKGRAVPMHPRVAYLLTGMWHTAGKPASGPVFLSRRGKPYTDTREKGQGGNPLSKAHATACRLAGVRDFRVHDWRHHWAAERVMAGVDLFAVMRLGGWSTLKMVQRYASVTADHLRDAIRRTA